MHRCIGTEQNVVRNWPYASLRYLRTASTRTLTSLRLLSGAVAGRWSRLVIEVSRFSTVFRL
jgi:hypothetical protein